VSPCGSVLPVPHVGTHHESPLRVECAGRWSFTYALKGTEEGTLAQRLVPNLAYQTAKIVSYMLVGLLLGAIGSAFDLDAIRPYAMLVAGAFMIVLALGMTGRVPWAARFTPRPPKFLVRAFTAVRRKAVTDAERTAPRLRRRSTFGLLTGLMPCAPLMAAQLNAAASGSAITGAIAMLAFGLGTAPLMLGFGTASSLIPRKLKERVIGRAGGRGARVRRDVRQSRRDVARLRRDSAVGEGRRSWRPADRRHR